MRLRWKFLFHFFGQMLIVILLLTVMLVASFFYLDARFSDAESNSGLTKATTDTLEAYLDVNEDGTWEVDNFLKKSVDKQHGWMQIIDSEGNTDYSYGVPKDVPGTYTKKELLSIYKTKKLHNYKLNYWAINIEDKSYLLLSGWKSKSEQLLTSVEKREQKIDSLAHYKSSTIDYIKRKKGAIYLLDSNGKILDSINSTKSERKTMNQLELLKYSSKPWNYKREISVKILDRKSVV